MQQLSTLKEDELKLTNDRLSSMEYELITTKEILQAEIKASSDNVIKWVASIQLATIVIIVLILTS